MIRNDLLPIVCGKDVRSLSRFRESLFFANVEREITMNVIIN